MNSTTETHVYSQLSPAFITWVFIGLFGVFGNATLFLVTLQYTSLQSSSHYLVQQKAFANCISCGYFVYFGIMGILSTNGNPVASDTNWHCVLKVGLHIASITVNTLSMLYIAIDRFLGICFPAFYTSISKTVYQLAAAFSWLIGLLHFVIAYVHSNNDMMILCISPASFAGNSFHTWNNYFIVVNILVLGIYSFTVFKAMRNLSQIRRSLSNSRRNAVFKKHIKAIRRSITLIVAVYLITWVATATIMKIFTLISDNDTEILIVYGYVGILAACDAASDFPILFWRGNDYRKATREFLSLKRAKYSTSECSRLSQHLPSASQRF